MLSATLKNIGCCVPDAMKDMTRNQDVIDGKDRIKMRSSARHDALKRFGRAGAALTAWLKDFVLLAAGSCLIALTIKVYPVIGRIQASAEQTTKTLKSLEAATDQLNSLEASAQPVATRAQAVLDQAQKTIAASAETLGKVSDAASALKLAVDHTDVSLNRDVLPGLADTEKQAHVALAEVARTSAKASDAIQQFNLRWVRNPQLAKIVQNTAESTANIHAILADAQHEADKFVAPKTRWQRVKAIAEYAGRVGVYLSLKFF